MLVVHVVTRMNVGGVASLVSALVLGLPSVGVEARLVYGDVQGGESEVFELPPDAVRIAALGRAPNVRADLKALRDLRQVLRQLAPDVVHTHTAKAGALGRMAAEGLGAARVHTFHGHLLTGYFPGALKFAVVAAERILATRTDLLISSGERVGQDLRHAGIGRGRPWLNVPPGVKSPTPSGVRTGSTVAFVGRLVPIKRPDRLIEIARLLPEVQILIAGDGPLRAELQRRSPSNVEFLGWVSDVGEVYGRSDLVLLTSDNEAMPLALIEGALAGLPSVTTDAGSASEVVRDGITGLVCGFSAAELAKAISILVADPALRCKMGDAAKAQAQSRYTDSAMVRAHQRAYASLRPPEVVPG